MPVGCRPASGCVFSGRKHTSCFATNYSDMLSEHQKREKKRSLVEYHNSIEQD